MDDRELLRDYVEYHSEQAFSELVRRHVNLVFGTAQRIVRDAAAAQDIVQAVFIRLANKAWTIRDGNALASWLYRATYNEACNAVRKESRRRQHETEAMIFADDEVATPAAWERLGPLVDEAMQRLSRVEQTAVVLRYFEGKSMEETGAALGTTEAAARMRLSRAMEKIRKHFARGGVTIGASALVLAFSTHACKAAPAALAASVAHTSLAGAGSASLAQTLWRIFTMSTKSKVILTALVMAVAAAIPLEVQREAIVQLETVQSQAAARPSAGAIGKRAGGTATLAQYEAELKRILSMQGGLALTRSLLDFTSGLDAASARALLVDLAKLPPTDKNKLALGALIDRLVHLDPKGAFELANSVATTHGRELMLGILFDTWSNIDPERALAALADIAQPALREALIGQVIENMIRSNPQAALEMLRTLPGNKTAQDIYSKLFNTWGSQDPAAASAAVLSLPATQNRNLAILGLVNGWATVDPVAALTWSGNLPTGEARNQAVKAAIGVLAQQDPQAAVNFVSNITNSTYHNQLVLDVVDQWGQDDPVAAMAWVQSSVTGKTHDEAIVSVIGPLSQVDPQSAANIVVQMPQGGGRRMMSLTQVASNWAEQDPQADLAWLQSIPNATRTPMMIDAVSSWAKSDPAAATAYVESVPRDDPAFPKMVASLANSQASVDANAAMAWAQALPADGGRDDAITAVIGKLSDQDPVMAAAVVLALPAGTAQTNAVQTISANWAAADPVAAAQWILTVPDGYVHDTAVTHFNSVVQQDDPATAFKLALTVGNSTTQSNQLNRVLGFWLKTDPAAAAATVQSADISDATRTRLLNTLQTGTPAPASSSGNN